MTARAAGAWLHLAASAVAPGGFEKQQRSLSKEQHRPCPARLCTHRCFPPAPRLPPGLAQAPRYRWRTCPACRRRLCCAAGRWAGAAGPLLECACGSALLSTCTCLLAPRSCPGRPAHFTAECYSTLLTAEWYSTLCTLSPTYFVGLPGPFSCVPQQVLWVWPPGCLLPMRRVPPAL